MPEGRKGKKDAALQRAFLDVCENGTYYVGKERFSARLTTTENLKFRYKRDNIAGQQLCDLLAHPSHMNIRERQNHDIAIGPFGRNIVNLLNSSKYDRSGTGQVAGYGYKYFP